MAASLCSSGLKMVRKCTEANRCACVCTYVHAFVRSAQLRAARRLAHNLGIAPVAFLLRLLYLFVKKE